MSPMPLRRSQVISPFGVGAMVDFPGPISLIHAGLDAWPFIEREKNGEHEEFIIEDEERLSGRLCVDYFVLPPDYRYISRGGASVPNIGLKLPFLRFPCWHFCPRCGRMFESELHDLQAPVCKGPIGTGAGKGKPHNPRKTLQVRFVAACMKGHLQDFPWWEWVLESSNPDKQGKRLRMNSSGSASVAGVKIICEKDTDNIHILATKSLASAFTFKFGEYSSLDKIEVTCNGHNPALAIPSSTKPAPGCGESLYPMLRGSSNIYFPHEVRSIFLPPEDNLASEEVLEILENHRVRQFFAMLDEKITPKRAQKVLSEHYPDRNVSAEMLADAANRQLGYLENPNNSKDTSIESDTEETEFRRQEYNLFCKDIQEGQPKTNLLIRVQDVSEYESIVSDNFRHLALLHKLRETRAFVGFTRIVSNDRNINDEAKRDLISRSRKNWLPAVTVRGEGIFLVLNETEFRKWTQNESDNITRRLSYIFQGLGPGQTLNSYEDIKVTARLVLLHTLSHLLINQLIFECGYGSASLRERLYCSDDDKHPMSGILIYTAAGDSEGTMGGLVRMGKQGYFEPVMQRALTKACWCSTDPVCIESKGQGPDNCNLAACHACALLPETSCELQNRVLDRGLLIGTIENPDMGFFSNIVQR